WTRLGTALAYIALAFFIVRISLAAAIAAGEPGLSCVAAGAAGAFFCCATAGTAVRASPAARPAADKIRERLFIPILLDYRRYRRSTTRIPCAPARTAVLARPMNNPCSQTPRNRLNSAARHGG